MSQAPSRPAPPALLLFDFGGVIADEGFVGGLAAIARANAIDPGVLLQLAVDIIFSSGYLIGQAKESLFWEQLRSRAAIRGDDVALRGELLTRFRLRPRMMDIVDRLRAAGRQVAVLSDQTNWLDEIESAQPFAHRFDRIFNSYHVGLHKRDPACFTNALETMGFRAGQALFVDDLHQNTELARNLGLRAIHYREQGQFETELLPCCPEIAFPDPKETSRDHGE